MKACHHLLALALILCTEARAQLLAVQETQPTHVPVRFSNLRFEEDWSALGRASSTTDHLLPAAKWLALPDGWALSFGGQLRVRASNEKDKAFDGPGPRRNDYVLTRTRLHADLRNENGWRLFAEGLDARVHGNERAPAAIDRNNLDLHNAFVEYGQEGALGRVGRMELQYGAQRLVSPLDWGNTRRRFQGGLARLRGEGHRSDVFLTRPTTVDPRAEDTGNSKQHFAGIYHSQDVGESDTLDVFLLQLRDDRKAYTAENGSSDDLQVNTFGARLHGALGHTDYELWTAFQTGRRAGDGIDAHAWSIVLGHSFPDTKGAPKIGIGVDYASGDSNPTDGERETFHQLYPLGHAYLGYLDLVGRQNIIDVSPHASVKVGETSRLRVAWHMFRLAQRKDGLYNAGARRSFYDPTGKASREVGDEIDLTLSVRPDFLSPHSQLLLGYSHFDSGQRIQDLGGSKNADLVYLQLTQTF